ncbi:conserved hypothetical protein [Acinetobacter proteolyticus]|jgi:hypothetical protein|uniref:DUF6868 domain-containing protein n=1 Tax=Acinetobacter proteolyticus TaxID=1776741 RepID=A0A653K7S6_9GAMM|nr:hypothetical protein [Acinetobacter proteolyticus]QHH93500.1 hypothetical protein FPL18_06460 [Acinetobacter gyllenbergii]WEI19360.1 hypothetical protein PY247_05055 [Acinetobacter proteolyticus]VXA56988.1 conserved hypothetical protein [Acinetobacter proteolyticus]
MNTFQLTQFFLYMTILNYIVLILWFLAFVFAKDSIKRLHRHWFSLSEQQFDAIHYGGMAIYKIAILLFGLVPYLALKLL